VSREEHGSEIVIPRSRREQSQKLMKETNRAAQQRKEVLDSTLKERGRRIAGRFVEKTQANDD